MKLRQTRQLVHVRRIGVFADDPPNKWSPCYTIIRLKEARARYPWLVRLGDHTFTPLMIDPIHVIDNPPSVFWRQTRHSEKIRLNRLSRRRNRQHIAEEDFDFRRVRVNRRFFE